MIALSCRGSLAPLLNLGHETVELEAVDLEGFTAHGDLRNVGTEARATLPEDIDSGEAGEALAVGAGEAEHGCWHGAQEGVV
jgi:hypothetical protein